MTQTKKCTVTYRNGDAACEYDSIQQAASALLDEFPGGVIYDAGGWDHDEDDGDENYDVRSGRAALVWESEANSANDNGAKAVAEISVSNAS
jgi:hypothetical protein